MTVSEFAVAMYGCEIVKDQAIIIRDGETLYNGRMEFLRYADEYDPKNKWFAGERIQSIIMNAADDVRKCEYCPDYITVITI